MLIKLMVVEISASLTAMAKQMCCQVIEQSTHRQRWKELGAESEGQTTALTIGGGAMHDPNLDG